MPRKTSAEILKELFFLIVLAILPVILLFNNYSHRNGFLDLPMFGDEFKASRLKEINDINPPTKERFGYDGQFYAQMALDPLLIHDETIRALDNMIYRTRRVGLPFMAFLLGIGKPLWVLHIYTLLNFVFWIILLLIVYHYLGFRYSRDFLLAVSVLWSSGTLASLSRALTDLPAVTLSILAVFLIAKRNISASLLSSAALCKETAALSFFLLAWPEKKSNLKPRQFFLSCLIMILPFSAWLLYVHLRIKDGVIFGNNNFAPPFWGLISKITTENLQLFKEFSFTRYNNVLYELICPLSLVAQSFYLISKPKAHSPYWRLGVGFAILPYLLGSAVWVDQLTYSRVLLPLTICFNFLIHKHERNLSYAFWYFIGNIGMSWVCINTIVCALTTNFVAKT